MQQKVAVLLVCLGHICRSPTAEAVFRAKVEEAGLADRLAVEQDDEGAGGVAALDHVADGAEFLVGIAPPLTHMRPSEPVAQQRIVVRRHRGEADMTFPADRPAIRHRAFRR